MLMQPEGFADDTPDAIAHDVTACGLRGHSEPQTWVALIVEANSHTEEPVPHAPAARVDRFEVRLPPQAPLRGKGESGMRAAVSQRPSSFPPAQPARGLSNQGMSFLRPFERRRLSTLRPFLVAMRARKPCVRLRRSLLG